MWTDIQRDIALGCTHRHYVPDVQVNPWLLRYHWDCNTAYSFVKCKLEMFEFSDEAIEGLEHFETQLMKYYTKCIVQNIKNSHIFYGIISF